MDTKGSTGIGRWLWIGVACLPTAALPAISMGPARADEPLAVASSYGAGVHAYYDGDYQTAYDALTAAIEAGSLDPRAYYYRGLASIKLGRADDEIDGDFSEGASRESMGRGGLSVSPRGAPARGATGRAFGSGGSTGSAGITGDSGTRRRRTSGAASCTPM